MNKQKLFRVLTVLGLIFTIFVLGSYFYTLKTRGDIVEQKVEVPKDFARYFDRVLTKNRYLEMERATFLSPEGRRLNWQVFDGKYLLVNFWATWCPPCVLELPSLDGLQKKFKGKGLEVISISMDTARSHEDIKKFLENRGIGRFAAHLDDAGEVQKSIYMRGLPTSYLLDPSGRVIHIFEGDAVWDSPAGINFFKTVLNAQSK